MAFFITDKCIGCTVCDTNCPTDTISGQRNQLYTIHPEDCIDCGVCAIYCPVDAIMDPDGNIVKRIKPRDIPKAKVDPDFCTGCDYCIEICPEDCISLVPRDEEDANAHMGQLVAVVNEKKCVSCKLCEMVCAKNAIWVDRDTPYIKRPIEMY